MLEFCPPLILYLLVHGDVGRGVVVLGIEIGRLDVKARFACDGRFGKDCVEGGDGEGAGSVTRAGIALISIPFDDESPSE